MSVDLEFLAKHVNQCEVRANKYHIPKLYESRVLENHDEFEEKYPAFQCIPNFTEARLCTWAFMKENEVEELVDCSDLTHARKMLENKLCRSYPKESPKIILVDLLYSCLKYAKSRSYNTRQIGALLSMIYLTHSYFTCSYTSTAEDVFHYFKEILTCHSVQFIPLSEKIFDADEAYNVLNYFCKIYLRHLPIIRLMSLPNFGFELSLEVEPAPVFKKAKKEGKGKKK